MSPLCLTMFNIISTFPIKQYAQVVCTYILLLLNIRMLLTQWHSGKQIALWNDSNYDNPNSHLPDAPTAAKASSFSSVPTGKSFKSQAFTVPVIL